MMSPGTAQFYVTPETLYNLTLVTLGVSLISSIVNAVQHLASDTRPTWGTIVHVFTLGLSALISLPYLWNKVSSRRKLIVSAVGWFFVFALLLIAHLR